jgi:outer membrane protein assembly factor BamB
MAAADWTSFHKDRQNSGFQAGSSYQVYEDVWWSNKTAGSVQIEASPILIEGKVIMADKSGNVRALDAESGKQIWAYKMPAGVVGTPAAESGRVFVVDQDGALKALNVIDGRVEGEASVGKTFGSISISEGKLFIGNEAGEMKAFLASTMTPLWTFKVTEVFNTASAYNNVTGVWTCTAAHGASPGGIRSAPVIYDGKVYFGSMNHHIYAVDEQGIAGSGKTKVMWTYTTGDLVVASPTLNILTNGVPRIVFGSYDGKLYSFHPSPQGQGGNNCFGLKHTPAWTYTVPSIVDDTSGQTIASKIHSSPANSGDKVYVGANNGRLYAVVAGSGQLAWEAILGSPVNPVRSSPAISSGIVVVGSDDKRVYWVDATDGKVLKSFATESGVGSSPALDGSRAYIASNEGTLYMFGPKLPPRPDLVVDSIEADTKGIRIRIKNQGEAPSGNTTVRLFQNATFLADVQAPSLGPGGSQVVEYVAKVASGRLSLRAHIDPDDRVRESVETNNALSKTIDVRAPAPTGTNTETTTQQTTTETTKKKDDGVKIPAFGLAPVLALVGVALVLARRRA